MPSHKKPKFKLPEEFLKYFWDVPFKKLNFEKNLRFLAERLLNYGDLNRVKWLLSHIDIQFIKTLVETSRNLNPKTKNYWNIMLK
jgi:hypothetical protein